MYQEQIELVENKELTNHGEIIKEVLDGIYEEDEAKEFIVRLNKEYGREHIVEFFEAIGKH